MTCPCYLTVMVAILVKNLIVTFLIPPAKLLVQYMLRLLMKNQRIPLMLVLEWPQANTPTTAITTNSSYDTVKLHDMNPNECYGIATR